MSGSVYKRGDRNWAFSLYLGRDPNTGKQSRIFKSGYETKRAAQEGRELALQELRERRTLKWAPRTIGELLEAWFKEHAEQHCSPKTVERYRQLVAYLQADFCAHDIAEVDPLVLEQEFNRLRASGGHHRKTREARPLSGKTVRAIASILHSAFQAALRWRFLRFNPMEAVQLPRVDQHEKEVLDADQTRVFLEATAGHWIRPIVMFAAATGCRRGEMLALQWPDLDFEKRTANVRQSLEQTKAGLRVKPPKNGRPRLIHLPGSLVEALRAHKTSQDRNRRMFGADYRTEMDLVFADPSGDYLKPDSVTATACLLAGDAGLKGVGLHSLRHSHGSQLLSEGVSLPAVSKRLGHSSPDVTARVYAHSFKSDEVDAAQIWDDSVGAVLQTPIADSPVPDGSVAECSKVGVELLMLKGMSGSANGSRTRI